MKPALWHDAATEAEWPTLAVLAGAYAVWAAAVFWLADVSLVLAIGLAGVAAAQHSSVTHEVVHGHPFRAPVVNALLVAVPLTIFIPFLRFKDLHLAHHRDEILTDPYDDPESNYLDPAIWARKGRPMRALLRANNTLLGRIVIGPLVGTWAFVAADLRMIRGGDRRAALGWALHLPGLAVLLWLVAQSPMPLWACLVSAWVALGLLKIRTFLEHRAHDRARARTVVVEDRGLLALLFLNNCYHAVHHMHPRVAWYRLPALYAQRRAHYLSRNDGYRYTSYGEVFRRYFLKAKDPVPHPLWTPDGRVGQVRPAVDHSVISQAPKAGGTGVSPETC